MLGSIVCISVEATKEKEVSSSFDSTDAMGFSQLAAGVLAILCGLCGAILLSTKHLFIRLYKANYSGIDMGIDASMCEFFLLFCLFISPLSQVLAIGWREVLIGSAAGILIGSARICMAIGVSTGLAAPANALNSTLALYQAFWSAMLAG